MSYLLLTPQQAVMFIIFKQIVVSLLISHAYLAASKNFLIPLQQNVLKELSIITVPSSSFFL